MAGTTGTTAPAVNGINNDNANGTDTAKAKQVPFILNGKEYHPAASFEVKSPVTGEVVHRCGSVSEAEARAAADAAAAAFPAWRDTPPRTRRDLFLRAAEIMQRRREELMGYMMAETGAARGWAEFNVDTARDFLIDVAGRICSLEGTVPTTQDPTRLAAMVLMEPYGVVLAVSPWNAPYILCTRAVAFPIAAGNTVVLKGSELSPRVIWAVCSVLHEAGLPPGVLNFVVHEPSPSRAEAVTRALVAHEQVKKINFTGSSAVGRIIAAIAGEYLKPVLLELGGKAPAIVWEDADLPAAARHCAVGAFLNAGQICMSTERILVHASVRAAFEAHLVAAIDDTFGSSADAPQLISAKAVAKAKRLVRDAVGKGAAVLYGDKSEHEHGEEGTGTTRMRPLVLGNVVEEMDIYRTESFGPTVSVIEVSSEEEALRIANDTEYGLTASVFTEDLRRGLRLARGIEAGVVHINGMTVHDESALIHGGTKASGYGRFNASGLLEWVRSKTVTYRLN